MTVYDLNEKYFELYSRLNNNKEFVSSTAFKSMTKGLDKLYENELRIVMGAITLETAENDFVQKFKLSAYVPKRRLFGYNRIAKAFLKRCKAEFRVYLSDVLNETRELKNYAENNGAENQGQQAAEPEKEETTETVPALPQGEDVKAIEPPKGE